MKLRHGFVSNSSTTSFTLYGVSGYWDRHLRWELDSIIGKAEIDFDTYSHPHSDTIYVGRSYTKMQMDETRRSFENRTAADMANIFKALKEEYEKDNSSLKRYSLPEDINEIINNPQNRCCDISDGWYDG